MKKISPDDLAPLDLFSANEPIKIDLVYAKENHPRNIFKAAIYRPEARMWLHKDLAAVTLWAARKIHKEHGYIFELKDGLRTTEAQSIMNQTEIVKAHPHWTAPGPRQLVSTPGTGGHPRGMAIDVCLLDESGEEIDMGVPFDYFSENPDDNPASRSYTGFSDDILEHRQILEDAFLKAGDDLGIVILPLHSEWWDFRLPPEISEHFEPLSDYDLPEDMRMCGGGGPDVEPADYERAAQEILDRISHV